MVVGLSLLESDDVLNYFGLWLSRLFCLYPRSTVRVLSTLGTLVFSWNVCPKSYRDQVIGSKTVVVPAPFRALAPASTLLGLGRHGFLGKDLIFDLRIPSFGPRWHLIAAFALECCAKHVESVWTMAVCGTDDVTTDPHVDR